jgi:peptide chain release factor
MICPNDIGADTVQITPGVILETLWLSVSSGNGPEECAHAAALTLQVILTEIEDLAGRGTPITAAVEETEVSSIKGNIRSALLRVKGEGVSGFAASWTGIIQWIWRSEYRPHHKRKNWFISVKPHREAEKGTLLSLNDVRFETARSGGKGGQKVNKTETAVRAVHIPSGKSAVSRDERFQFTNRKTALERLTALLAKEQGEREQQNRSQRRHTHYELERGNPIRVYDGETLQLIALQRGRNNA